MSRANQEAADRAGARCGDRRRHPANHHRGRGHGGRAPARARARLLDRRAAVEALAELQLVCGLRPSGCRAGRSARPGSTDRPGCRCRSSCRHRQSMKLPLMIDGGIGARKIDIGAPIARMTSGCAHALRTAQPTPGRSRSRRTPKVIFKLITLGNILAGVRRQIRVTVSPTEESSAEPTSSPGAPTASPMVTPGINTTSKSSVSSLCSHFLPRLGRVQVLFPHHPRQFTTSITCLFFLRT